MATHMQRTTPSSAEHAAAAARLRSTLAGVTQAITAARQRVAPARIDSLELMYHAELQELDQSQRQAGAVAEEIWVDMRNERLGELVSAYAARMRSREPGVEALLARFGPETRQHPDQAMQALVREIRRIAVGCAEPVRDAAWAAALQRIVHQMISSYGTIAAHAKALGRTDEAARFAAYAAEERAADAELSAVAKSALNPQAAGARE